MIWDTPIKAREITIPGWESEPCFLANCVLHVVFDGETLGYWLLHNPPSEAKRFVSYQDDHTEWHREEKENMAWLRSVHEYEDRVNAGRAVG